MRVLFFLIAVLSIVIFIYSTAKFARELSRSQKTHFSEVKFSEGNQFSDEYDALVDKFRQTIKKFEDKSEKDKTRYFWLNFLVTALTAGSTLISSLKAAKKDPTPNAKSDQKFAIIIAIIAFCITISNFGASHFKTLQDNEFQKAAEIAKNRNQFILEYHTAKEEDKSSKIQIWKVKTD